MMYVKEVSVSNCQKFGFSALNKKHYNIRLKYGNTEIKLLNIFYSKKKNTLLIDIYVKPTFLGRKVYGKNYIQKEIEFIDKRGTVLSSKYRKYYNVRLLYESINKFISDLYKANLIEKYSERIKKRREIIKNLLYEHSYLRIWANDLRFLYQGAWNILSRFNSELYKFPKNLTDKGIWLKRHGNFGIHLTKHLIGVFDMLKNIVDKVEEKLRLNYKI